MNLPMSLNAAAAQLREENERLRVSLLRWRVFGVGMFLTVLMLAAWRSQ